MGLFPLLLKPMTLTACKTGEGEKYTIKTTPPAGEVGMSPVFQTVSHAADG
jgi:hypothetical protein